MEHKIGTDGVVYFKNVANGITRRWTLFPGMDVSTYPQEISSICLAAWTPEVIEAYHLKNAPPPPLPPTQDEIDIATAREYAKLKALRAMTPAQVATWVDNNVTNLSQAQDAIKTLAIAVSILSRRM